MMKVLNQFELEQVSGGNDLAYDIGHAVGSFTKWWDQQLNQVYSKLFG
ncbi:bacteriocin [uncultured Neisseria sp.]|nr:bacteriocin [uncultured Neisseria sp.]